MHAGSIHVEQSSLLKDLRGRRAQADVSRNLGYRFNKVHRWETGGLAIKWGDFQRFCKACNVDVSRHLRVTLGINSNPRNFSRILRAMAGTSNAAVIAKRTATSVARVRRLLASLSEPSLAEAFDLIHRLTGAGFAFYSALGGKNLNVDQLAKKKTLESLKQLLIEYPLCGVLDFFFQMPEYQRLERHKRGLLAKRFGISIEEESRLMNEMLAAGLVVYRGCKFASSNVKTINTAPANFAEHRKVLTYWFEQMNAALARQPDFDSLATLGGYRIMHCSRPTAEAIADRLVDFYHEVRGLLTKDEGPKEILQIMVQGIFDPCANR